MCNENCIWLNNVPNLGKDADKELARLLAASPKFLTLSTDEKQRLDYEMDTIKKFGAAKVFLFGRELINSVDFGTTLGAEGCSLVNYLLGISKVNPVIYNLPFERFYNHSKGKEAVYNIYATKGSKEKALKYLVEKFGEELFFQDKTHGAVYFVASNPMARNTMEECVDSTENQTVKKSFLEFNKLIESGFYRFGIIDSISNITYRATTVFTDEEILKKTLEMYLIKGEPIPEFSTVDEAVYYLKNAEDVFIYQEQFLSLCNRLLGVNYETADYFLSGYLHKQDDKLIGLERLINQKHPKIGEEFFYLLSRVMHQVPLKSYVIARLYNEIEWLEG